MCQPAQTANGTYTFTRRKAMQTTVAMGAAIGTGLVSGSERHSSHKVAAQEIDGVRARSWDEADSIDTSIKLEGGGWVTLQAQFPFWALGFAWDASVGMWPAVQFSVSYDGSLWEEGFALGGHDDGGPAPADDRIHTDLFFGDGQQYVRYRTVDGEGNLVILDRFQVTYIDPTDGPWEPDRGRTLMRTSTFSLANTDTSVPPAIITRAQWGANEKLRFDSLGEIWPAEYAKVKHAIVHHAAANYGSDGYNAVRSIYYYHCVTQGWGDIGYNYVVDVRGNIFEGRVGGANAIGGHAYQFAIGSSGICVMGDFSSADAPQAAKAALANIIAYVVRDLDPLGSAQFHEIPNLPTICAHRDVVKSTCPGNGLYDDMNWIRQTAKSIIDTGLLDSQMPGGIVPGDWVTVQTGDGSTLNLHAQPGLSQLIIDKIPDGTRLEIERGPVADSDHNWYLLGYNNKEGWVPADYLVVTPPEVDPMPGYSFGQNVQLASSVAIKSSPSTNAGTLATESGSWAFLLAGPYPAGGTNWFQVQTQNGRSGWITINQFKVADVTAPTSAYQLGQTVVTVRSTSIRVRPGVGQTVQAVVSSGQRLTVSVAPVGVTGRTWYGVSGGTGVGGGWVDANDIDIQPGPITQVGQNFRVTENLNLRSGAGTGYSRVVTLPAGTTGSVIGGPSNANGYTWWQLRTSGGTTGWGASNWLIATGGGTTTPTPTEPTNPTEPTPTPTGKFAIGEGIRVTENLNMRSGAGTGNGVVSVLPSGTTGSVVGGPTTANGYTWWRVQTSRGTGWVVENWIVSTGTSTPTQPTDPTPPTDPNPSVPTGKFAVGDSFRVTANLNMRSGAGTGNGVLSTLPTGTTGTITGGPTTASGYTWWQVQTSRGSGWVVQDWVEKTGGSTTNPPPSTSAKFAIGDTVRVTENLNTRSSASTGASLVAVLPSGTTGTVIGGPSTGSGYTWWKIQTSRGTGWSVQDWLTRA
ncbi:MAG: SH3 domain-containing protein [Thermomicrobiales bacterium]|nr:SH3 domain-containing protein [Thermomicrobiales bacterium]